MLNIGCRWKPLIRGKCNCSFLLLLQRRSMCRSWENCLEKYIVVEVYFRSKKYAELPVENLEIRVLKNSKFGPFLGL